MSEIRTAEQIIQQRYENNPENGIPYKDFVERYWQDTTDEMQRLLDTRDIRWIEAFAISMRDDYIKKWNKWEEITEAIRDKFHHVNNILQHMQFEIENILESEGSNKKINKFWDK